MVIESIKHNNGRLYFDGMQIAHWLRRHGADESRPPEARAVLNEAAAELERLAEQP